MKEIYKQFDNIIVELYKILNYMDTSSDFGHFDENFSTTILKKLFRICKELEINNQNLLKKIEP